MYYRSTPHHDPVLLHDRNQKINNKQLGQTLHGDAIYVTIFWTSDDCNRLSEILSYTCPLDKCNYFHISITAVL